ncbi:unnamed protein product [Closterium sp. Yama58-4]|nr:unnamed protein product [Closterium sp. Yama58-4]
MADENQQAHAVARKAPVPVAPGAPAPSALAAPAGARSFSSRRVLAEVGNLVELTAAAAAATAAGKDGKLPTSAAAATATAAAPAQLDKGAREACASAATSATAATVDVPVLLAVSAASSSAATEQPSAEAAAAKAGTGAGGACGGRKVGEREEREERESEEEGVPMLTMTMTASLTACSEEACGGGGGSGGSGGVDLMDAEVPAVMDIDWEDRRNPLAATAYVRDIYALYRRMEVSRAAAAGGGRKGGNVLSFFPRILPQHNTSAPFSPADSPLFPPARAHVQRETMAAESYMSQQADINDKMRAILLDWLIEVHLKFKLMPETLYLTANLIDRYLSLAPVRRRNLQLVGVTAMLIASKYEEIWAPEVRDFVYISDNAYSRAEVIALEKDMLNALRFQLTVPTPYVFASRFLKAAAASVRAAAGTAAGGAAGGTTGGAVGAAAAGGGAEKVMQSLAWFLLELSLPEYSMLRFSPSHLAAAAVYTAMLARSQNLMSHQSIASGGVAISVTVTDGQTPATSAAASAISLTLGRSISTSTSSCSSSSSGSSGASSSSSNVSRPFWCPVMVLHTGYTEAELQPCVRMMVELQHKAGTGNLTAVYKKYSTPRFGEVAKLPHVTVPTAAPGQ